MICYSLVGTKNNGCGDWPIEPVTYCYIPGVDEIKKDIGSGWYTASVQVIEIDTAKETHRVHERHRFVCD